MKRPLKRVILLFVSMIAIAQSAEALWAEPRLTPLEKKEAVKRLWIADFEDGQSTENTGVWVHNILDPDQSIKTAIVYRDAMQKTGGKVLRLDYDVDSPNSAMVGFWVNLRNQDLSGFDTLHLSLRAGDDDGFPGNIALQFKDTNNHKAPYLISHIPAEWKEFQVPLGKFKRITDWAEIKEFEIIIDDINARPKEGSFYVDQIYVSSKKGWA